MSPGYVFGDLCRNEIQSMVQYNQDSSGVERLSRNRESLGVNPGHGGVSLRYKFLFLILAQNNNEPHHEVEFDTA